MKQKVIYNNVEVNHLRLMELPDLSDVIVKGIFECRGNYITSLDGSPKECRSFYCSYNPRLKSLKGAPKKILKEFNCYKTILDSLEYSPEYVGDLYYASKTNIINLKGITKHIGGDLALLDNEYLQTLEGGEDTEVYGDVILTGCKSLTSLKGIPKYIGGSLYLPYQLSKIYTLDDIKKMTTIISSIFVS